MNANREGGNQIAANFNTPTKANAEPNPTIGHRFYISRLDPVKNKKQQVQFFKLNLLFKKKSFRLLIF
jgi:hypothetical protein